jgi:hypothetical protein
VYSIAWTGTRIVAVTSTESFTSPDGAAWTPHEDLFAMLRCMIWTGTKLVGLGYDGIWTSADGEAWDEVTPESPTSPSFTSIIKTGSGLMAFSEDGLIFSSPDGSAWTRLGSGNVESLNSLAWSGSEYAAVGARGTVLTSPDAITWTERTSGTEEELRSVVWAGTRFVAVGDNGAAITSPDGIAWTARTTGIDADLTGVAWTGTRVVAVGEATARSLTDITGTILTSPDGEAWSPAVAGTTADLRSVAWSGTRLVAVGDLEYPVYTTGILTSPDGITWTKVATDMERHLHFVGWGNNQFVALADGGGHLSSPDGVQWKDTTMGSISNAAAWTGKQWVAASGTKAYYTSTTGMQWTREYRKVGAGINALLANGDMLVGVGNGGNIVTGIPGTLALFPSRHGSAGFRLTPGSRVLSVSLPEDWQGLTVHAEIRDLRGCLAASATQRPQGRALTIPTGSLARGIYVVGIAAGNKHFRQAFVADPR